ncbi:glycine cleavage system aminomethyltransferase GcvT [Microbacterium sediminicola]
MSDLRTTPLHERHRALGASFTAFGDWSMPIRYGSELAEHRAVREAAGLFDISHMAEFIVEGPGAAAALDAALSRRVSTLAVGRAAYALLLSAQGGVLDDLIVYRLDEWWFLVIANAGNRGIVAHELGIRLAARGVRFEDASDSFALIALQGPAAQAVLGDCGGVTEFERPPAEIPRYGAARARFGGDEVLVARTGYTGEDGFEILVPSDLAVPLWDELLAAGESHGLVPAGLAARDTLRLEAGMPLHGHEISAEVLPAQAGLSWAVEADRSGFVGENVLRESAGEARRVLVGLASEGRRAGRAGYAVMDAVDGAIVGEVTSGALSPTLGHPIALAFVDPTVSSLGTALAIDVRGTAIPTTVTALPFYRRKK